jgi:hypothetical protein
MTALDLVSGKLKAKAATRRLPPEAPRGHSSLSN